eukprot:TRINITY_DN67631_c1_g1_i1.p1 TRINITY_DN67631_c1_g1~~TRINITY_DN67631_c1_g1_i1.p1  ORF type:complete len:158 (+),score=47.22 TRINITY_DN67631_c1_g1_i1:41-475(+)
MPQITVNIDIIRRSRYFPRIYAPRFSKPKDESWWVVIGDPQRNELLAVKRLNFKKRTSTKLVFDWDEETFGEGNDPDTPDGYTFHFYLVCDSYIGLDQELAFTIKFDDIPEKPEPKERNPANTTTPSAPPDDDEEEEEEGEEGE